MKPFLWFVFYFAVAAMTGVGFFFLTDADLFDVGTNYQKSRWKRSSQSMHYPVFDTFQEMRNQLLSSQPQQSGNSQQTKPPIHQETKTQQPKPAQSGKIFLLHILRVKNGENKLVK